MLLLHAAAQQPVSLRQFQAGRSSGSAAGRAAWRRDRRRPSQAQAGGLAHGQDPSPPHELELLRVLAVTDLHVDYLENMEWCEAIDNEAHRRDVLVVSGDVSDELESLEAALGTLASKFGAVFYTPGNHELWVRERDRACGVTDSLTKLHLIMEVCARLGVHTSPRRVGSLWLVPLLSWHHRSWDREPDIPGVPPISAWTCGDYSACKWPLSVPGGDSHGSQELAQWFDDMNDTPAWRSLLASRADCDVISFSHFLPHQTLLPEKRFLIYPHLAKAVGSVPLAVRLRQLRPQIHLFGHTHFSWDARLGGTRYLQAPLCSPHERQRRLFTVGFGATMDQAQADPQGATWLPLTVYQALVPLGAIDALRAEAGEVAAPAAAQQQQGGQQGRQQQPSSNERAGVRLPYPQQRQQQHAQRQQAAGSQQAHALHALGDEGWWLLRHGLEAPPLHAHWSDWYKENQRQPEVVTLAPWVADRWHKRRARVHAAAQRGRGGSDGSASEPEESE